MWRLSLEPYELRGGKCGGLNSKLRLAGGLWLPAAHRQVIAKLDSPGSTASSQTNLSTFSCRTELSSRKAVYKRVRRTFRKVVDSTRTKQHGNL